MSAAERWNGPAGAPSYDVYLAHDGVGAPEVLKRQHRRDLGTAPLAAERYTSQTFFELEATRLWPRVWQMACREEDIPAVGDALVYEVVGKSFVVVRTAPDRIRAYYNSCLHRGRKLLLGSAPGSSCAHVDNLRCPFHGFTWHLDGGPKFVPCRGDFPTLRRDEDLRLPEARVETWGGFVFLNMDANAPPLAQYLAPLPEHFARWGLERRIKAAHVGKVIACNWKVAQEAFMESYHVIATHPQILEFCADANARYDLLGDHVNRNLTAFGAPSPHLAGRASPDRAYAGLLAMYGQRDAGGAAPLDWYDARRKLGARVRESFRRAYGGDWSQASDAEVLDALVYNVFPNFAPWAGYAPNIVYRWRPHGRDVNSCLMEVMILKPVKEGAEPPRAVPFRLLGDRERWSDAGELPVLGAVIDQDMENMPYVQEGLLASGTGQVHLAGYQESRIRHFHATLDRYLAVEPSGT
ncbi:MAG: aromatic ring-hydroxylating oxygenase subunit alpha [Pseudomonadota bacterium]